MGIGTKFTIIPWKWGHLLQYYHHIDFILIFKALKLVLTDVWTVTKLTNADNKISDCCFYTDCEYGLDCITVLLTVK